MLIVVAAGEHPELDDWVWEQARAEAARSGVQLGEYWGREDRLPVSEGLCCHVFIAIDSPSGTVGNPKEPTDG